MTTVHWQFDWSKVPEGYGWAAVDENGEAYAFKIRPELGNVAWMPAADEGACFYLGKFMDAVGDWKRSLVCRRLGLGLRPTSESQPQDEALMEFGALSREEKMELLAAWVDGKPIQAYTGINGGWRTVAPPMWQRDMAYRVAPVAPTIDWAAVASDYRFLVVAPGGGAWLFKNRPVVLHGRWASSGTMLDATGFASFRPGTLPWEETLVERPAGV